MILSTLYISIKMQVKMCDFTVILIISIYLSIILFICYEMNSKVLASTFCLLLLPLWESVIVVFCCALLYVHSSIAITLMGKRELVALLNLSSWCLVMVEWLFLAVL